MGLLSFVAVIGIGAAAIASGVAAAGVNGARAATLVRAAVLATAILGAAIGTIGTIGARTTVRFALRRTIGTIGTIGTAIRAFALIIFDLAIVGAGDALDLVAVAVVAGDLHAGAGQLLLEFGGGGEDDAAGGDEAGLDLVHVVHALGAQAEAHGAQSGQGDAVTFRGPRLDDLAGGVPAGLHHASADAAAQGCLLDYLGLSEGDVELGAHDIAVRARGFLVKLDEFFNCFYFKCHNEMI